MKKIVKLIYFLLILIGILFITYCLYDSGKLEILGIHKPQNSIRNMEKNFNSDMSNITKIANNNSNLENVDNDNKSFETDKEHSNLESNNNANNDDDDSSNKKKSFWEKLFSKKENKDKKNEEPEFKIEKKDYSDYYNKFNVDDRILLYDGKIKGTKLNELYDVLIYDADDNLFSKPNVKVSGNFIGSEDLENYKTLLKNLKDAVIENNEYNVFFEYNKLKTSIETIVIE